VLQRARFKAYKDEVLTSEQLSCERKQRRNSKPRPQSNTQATKVTRVEEAHIVMASSLPLSLNA
jgi:hypothetical protein